MRIVWKLKVQAFVRFTLAPFFVSGKVYVGRNLHDVSTQETRVEVDGDIDLLRHRERERRRCASQQAAFQGHVKRSA